MSAYEVRPGGMTGAPVRKAISKAASRKQRLIAEALARGDVVEERADGSTLITKKKRSRK